MTMVDCFIELVLWVLKKQVNVLMIQFVNCNYITMFYRIGSMDDKERLSLSILITLQWLTALSNRFV